MLHDNPIRGILPALVTPLDPNSNFDPSAMAPMLTRLYQAGIDGVYVCGSTGEGLALSPDTRKRMLESTVEFTPPGKCIIAHVGARSTPEAVDLARHAAGVGAHVISSLPPSGPYSFIEIKEYYRRLAGESAVPVLLYYFPAAAPSITTLDQIFELCALENVIGVKFTDSDFFRLWRIKKAGYVVFNGYDEMLASGLVAGADGGIGSTYNLAPELFVEMDRCARTADWERARVLQGQINEMIAVLFRFPVLAAVKSAMGLMGTPCGDCMPPRRPLTSEEKSQLKAALAELPWMAHRLVS